MNNCNSLKVNSFTELTKTFISGLIDIMNSTSFFLSKQIKEEKNIFILKNSYIFYITY